MVGYRVVLADGEVAELTAAPRAAMGPDLRRIFLGSEGTLGVITRVTLKIMPIPAARELAAFSVPDVVSGLAILRAQAARGLRPALLRLYDVDEARHAMADADVSSPVLFTGTEGEPAIAAAEMAVLTAIAEEHGAVAIGPEPVEAWLDRRFDFSTVERLLDTPGGYAETIEVAHTWRHIEALYTELRKVLEPSRRGARALLARLHPGHVDVRHPARPGPTTTPPPRPA